MHARNVFDPVNDLIDFTPELRAEALERLKRGPRWEPASVFMPPMLGDANGILGVIGAGTATNWPGGGYDPELHLVFAPAGNMPSVPLAGCATQRVLGHRICLRDGGRSVP